MEREILKKATAFLRQRGLRFGFTHDHRGEFPVRRCATSSRSLGPGYYAPLAHPERPRRPDGGAVPVGSPRRAASRRPPTMPAGPQGPGGRGRLLREHRGQAGCGAGTAAALRAARFVLTDSAHGHAVPANRADRRFALGEPDLAPVADITYIPTGQGGSTWRRCSTWGAGGSSAPRRPTTSSGASHCSGRCTSRSARPAPAWCTTATGGAYSPARLSRAGVTRRIEASMSRAGPPTTWRWRASSATPEAEPVRREARATREEEAERSLFEYIEVFYNRRRRHSTLGYLSPGAVR